MNRRMLLQKHFHDIGFMDTRAVPDENERSADMPSDMFQSYNQFLGIDRIIKMAFVDLAADRLGQSFLNQVWISSSSRSMARGSGFWTLQPRPCSNRLM